MNNNMLTLKYDSQSYKGGDLIDNWNSILLILNVDGNINLYLDEVKLLVPSTYYVSDIHLSKI